MTTVSSEKYTNHNCHVNPNDNMCPKMEGGRGGGKYTSPKCSTLIYKAVHIPIDVHAMGCIALELVYPKGLES